MTKEELKREAEEWLCNNLHSASEEDFIKAMVDIAEPREKLLQKKDKKIAELVSKNYKLEYQKENLENKIEHHQEVITTLQKKIAELEKEVKYYQAREQESGWSRFNELTQAEFNELCDYLNNVYEENKKLYNKAKESVCKVWERIAIARCGLWEMMFVKMFIQAYKQGKDSEVEND